MERDLYEFEDFRKHFGEPKDMKTREVYIPRPKTIYTYTWKLPADWIDIETDKRFLRFGTFPNYTLIHYEHFEVSGTIAAEDTTIRVVPYDYKVTLTLRDGSKVTIRHDRKMTREKEYLIIKVSTTRPPFLSIKH